LFSGEFVLPIESRPDTVQTPNPLVVNGSAPFEAFWFQSNLLCNQVACVVSVIVFGDDATSRFCRRRTNIQVTKVKADAPENVDRFATGETPDGYRAVASSDRYGGIMIGVDGTRDACSAALLVEPHFASMRAKRSDHPVEWMVESHHGSYFVAGVLARLFVTAIVTFRCRAAPSRAAVLSAIHWSTSVESQPTLRGPSGTGRGKEPCAIRR
jgi:hypothetical protein